VDALSNAFLAHEASNSFARAGKASTVQFEDYARSPVGAGMAVGMDLANGFETAPVFKRSLAR
jgi:hypothetical protein